jgi:hypothetical protein
MNNRQLLRLLNALGSIVSCAALSACGDRPFNLADPAGYHAAAANSDNTTCTSYGLKFGTPEYAQCRQNIASQRMANERAAIGAYMARQNQPAPAPYMMPVKPSFNTNCTTSGTNTNCQTQ